MPRRPSVSPEVVAKVVAKLKKLTENKTQSAVAKQLGLDSGHLSNVIRGAAKPSHEFAVKVLGAVSENVAADRKPRTNRGLRNRTRLQPRNKADRGLRDEHVDERPGDVLHLPGRGRPRHDLLAQEFSSDPEVVKLGKTRRTELDLQNKARMMAGLSQIKIKVVACLGCRTKFESPGERMCSKCRGSEVPVISGVEIV